MKIICNQKMLANKISIVQKAINGKTTLELLKGSQILRTDIDNSIRIKVNQNSNQILTYDSVKRKYVKWNKQY